MLLIFLTFESVYIPVHHPVLYVPKNGRVLFESHLALVITGLYIGSLVEARMINTAYL